MAPMEWHTRGDYTVGFSRLELRFMIGGTYGYGAGSYTLERIYHRIYRSKVFCHRSCLTTVFLLGA